MTITLERKGASIGRATNNTWVLPDPDKYVSSRHAAIEYRNSTYLIIDNSSNGVFILPSKVALGRGNSTALRDGDQLGIGEYQITASITTDEFLSSGNDAAPLFDSSGSIGNDAAPLFDSSRNTGGEQDPFMDLGADPIANLIEDADNLADDFSPPQETDEFDFFASPAASDSAKSNVVESNHVPSLDEAFSPSSGRDETPPPPFTEIPEAAASNDKEEGFLPENWFADDTEDENPFAAPKPSSTPPHPERDITPLEQPEEPSAVTPEIPAEPAAIQPQPVRKPTPAPPRSVPSTPVARPKTAPLPTVSNMESPEQIQDIIRHFCQGAGLDDEEFSAQLTPQSFYTIGKMLRISILGTMEVLLARTKIKNEMRLDVTTIRAAENNPIKFSINADEALARLLGKEEQTGYMEPVQALEEAYDDIKAHQMAVIAGMQTALQSVLKRFDPERLETRLQKQSPISASIPVHKQAKLWSQFAQLYEDIETEAQDDFNRLFGHAFASAYEEQVKQLKSRQSLDSDE